MGSIPSISLTRSHTASVFMELSRTAGEPFTNRHTQIHTKLEYKQLISSVFSELRLPGQTHTLLNQLIITPNTLIRAKRATIPGKETCRLVTVRHTEVQNHNPTQ